MTEKTINTPSGPIKFVITTIYNLSDLINLKEDQLSLFFKLFNVQDISTLIRILYGNELIKKEEIMAHPNIWDWISKSGTEIEKLMTDKGIWFPGMTKYLGIKVLLQSHSLVSSSPVSATPVNVSPINLSPSPTPVPPELSPVTINILAPINNTRDMRKTITTGEHYEIIPSRDFNIYDKRADLKRAMLDKYFKNNSMITTFDPTHLQFMFTYYNNHSFNNELSTMVQNKNRSITFNTNLNGNNKAGEHSYDPATKTHTLRLSPGIICNLFTNGETNLKTNGLIVNDRLDAMINVFEHELVHLYCSLKGYTRKVRQGEGKMYYSPHGKLFQELVFSFFGHTDYHHDFNHGEATAHVSKDQCSIGMLIYFETQAGKRVYGKIEKINPKKCKINTEGGSVYDVPYAMIRIADRDVKLVQKDKPTVDKNNYTVGSEVWFRSKTGNIKGKIIKCNPKRVRVETNRGIYDVPYENLS